MSNTLGFVSVRYSVFTIAIMQKIQAYFVGALFMFGSALWASIFAQNITSVIAFLAVPLLLANYIYATQLPQYVGAYCWEYVYMMVEPGLLRPRLHPYWTGLWDRFFIINFLRNNRLLHF